MNREKVKTYREATNL